LFKCDQVRCFELAESKEHLGVLSIGPDKLAIHLFTGALLNERCLNEVSSTNVKDAANLEAA